MGTAQSRKRGFVLRLLCLGLLLSVVGGVNVTLQAAEGPEIQYGQIKSIMEEGEYSEAARELEEFIRTNPGWDNISRAWVRYGEALLKSGDVEGAKEELLRLLSEADGFEDEELAARVRFGLGETYEAMGRYPFAVLGYESVVGLHPESSQAPEAALRGAWIAREVLNNQPRARDLYEMFLDRYPDHKRHAEILNLVGWMIEHGAGGEEKKRVVKRDTEEGASSEDQQFLKDIGSLPDDERTLQWDKAEAVSFYVKLGEQYPQYPGNSAVVDSSVAGASRALWRAADIALEDLDDADYALELVDKYLELPGAEREKAVWMKGEIYKEQNETDRAVEAFLEVDSIASDAQTRLKVAEELQEIGKEEEREKVLVELLKTSDSWAVAKEVLGKLSGEHIEEYLGNNPGDYHVLRYRLKEYADADELEGGREILNEWLERDDIDWKTAIAADWYGWTGERQDARAALRMAEQEGLVREIGEFALASADMPAVRKAAERVDELEEREAEIQDGDMEGDERQKQLDEINEEKEQLVGRREEARALLKRVIRKWGSYPDFPLDVLLDALRETVDGTEQVADLIVDQNYDKDPRVLGILAEMRREDDHDAALETSRRAAEELIEAGEFDAAAGHLEASLEGMPGDAADAADLLFSAASEGTRDEWGAAWEDLIVEASRAGYDAVQDRLKRAREAAEKREEKNNEKDEDGEKQDEPDWRDDLLAEEELEELRYRAVLFARPLKPQRTIEAADRFMDEHEDSSRGAQVARERFRAMKRAGHEDLSDRVGEAIEGIKDNPETIRNIPPELVHSGPGGMREFEKQARWIIDSKEGELQSYSRLALMECFVHRDDSTEAIELAEQILEKSSDPESTREAEDVLEQIMNRGYFPPDVGQEVALHAYENSFGRTLDRGVGTSFEDYSGQLWRISSHPAYQLRGFESFDRLYLYSTHGNVEKSDDMNAFTSSIYKSWPGDGTGPSTVTASGEGLEKGASPYRGGDKFLMMWWGVFRAPEDGKYRFWGDVDDWVGLELSGREFNFPAGGNGDFSEEIALNRGLHLIRIPYGDWGGNYNVKLEWQPPGGKRRKMGPEAFSAERNPLILSLAAQNRTAKGLQEWENYRSRYENDRRGELLWLQTLVMAEPEAALEELKTRREKYPHSSLYRMLYADCLWRLGRQDDSLEHYRELSRLPQRRNIGRFPDASGAGVYRNSFLRGEAPSDFGEQYEDRLREAGLWEKWSEKEDSPNGLDGRLEILRAVAMRVRALEGERSVAKSVEKRLDSTIKREEAALQSARELAEDEDADEDSRAEARTQAQQISSRVETLKSRVPDAERNVERTTERAADFRTAAGLEDGEDAYRVYYQTAIDNLSSARMSEGTIKMLTEDLWETGRRGEKVEPFLHELLDRSSDRWAVDRLVDIAMDRDAPDAAIDILRRAGERNPDRRDHARWYLRRLCNIALDNGRVFDFALNAHLLADLHPDQDKLAGFVSRLAEVYERAGNFRSAEAEYRRIMKDAEEDEVTEATLSLAEMFYGMQRPESTLAELSKLVDVYIPGEDGDDSEPAAAARYEEVEEEEDEDEATEEADDGEADEEQTEEDKEKEETEEDKEKEETEEDKEKEETEEETREFPRENTRALLLASRCYIMLERPDLAFDVYRRAEAQPDFGKEVTPEWDYLMDLAQCIADVKIGALLSEDEEDIEERDVPAEIMQRAEDMIDIADRIFELYAEQMDEGQKVDTLLLRADAHIMTRDYPGALEEIRQARDVAGESAVRYQAILKKGEVNLATDNVEQAISTFEKLAELDREDVSPQALFWLGTTRLMRGERDKAVEAFRRLWERYSGSDMVREAVYKIARTYADEGAFLEAIRLYEAVGAIDSRPQNYVVPGEMLRIKVEDADHYVSTGRAYMDVTLATSSGDEEVLSLEMNPINRSLFMKAIRTERAEPVPEDGVIQVSGDDAISVTYTDRFGTAGDDSRGPLEHVETIHVVDDGEIQLAPTPFVEVDEDEMEEDTISEEDGASEEEQERMRSLMPEIESGRTVLRPGNDMYIRVEDLTLSVSEKRDTATVEVFTYQPREKQMAETVSEETDKKEVLDRIEDPEKLTITENLPANERPTPREWDAPRYGNEYRKINRVSVEIKETEPHSGVFYGSLSTRRSGPTAVASEVLGDHGADNAIDGRNTADSVWRPAGDGRGNKWIEIDLKELHDISEVVWHRGEGAEDRYLQDYTVTFTGQNTSKNVEVTDNDSPRDAIELETPFSARWVRINAERYQGDAPAIAQIEIYDKDGERLVPFERETASEETEKPVLDLELGDYIGAEYLDSRNVEPGRPAKRVSNGMNTAYSDGYVDAVYVSVGENEVGGSPIAEVEREDGGGMQTVYGRRTKRVQPDSAVECIVVDADLNKDDSLNSAAVTAHSITGDELEVAVEQLGTGSDVFHGEMRISDDSEAEEDPEVLYARPGDFIALRYEDVENVDPGHSVLRTANIMVNEPEIARFPEGMVQLQTPGSGEEADADLGIEVFAPDQTRPGLSSLPVEALSFSTRDRIRTGVNMQNLDGLFQTSIPVRIGPKPESVEEEEKDEDDEEDQAEEKEKRARPLSQKESSGGPFAISGDDVVYFSLEDPTPEVPDTKRMIDVASSRFIRDVGMVHDLKDLPDAAVEQGIELRLTDPHLELEQMNSERRENVLREIARQKVHYRRQIDRYNKALEELEDQIETLSPEEEREEGDEVEADAEGVPDEPSDVTGMDDREEISEQGERDGGREEEMDEMPVADSDNLLKISNLRRQKEALEEALERLERRASDLERYDTEEEEKYFEEAFEEAAVTEEDDKAGEQEQKEQEEQEEQEWYEEENWWESCALIPGVSLNVVIEDPDIPDDKDELSVRAQVVGSFVPRSQEYVAVRKEKSDVFEVRIPTVQKDSDATDDKTDGTLELEGGERVVVSYDDPYQSDFPAERSSFVTLASGARVFLTDSNYKSARESYKLGEEIHVLLSDPDMSKTAARDYAWVELETESGQARSIALRETQPHSGEFRGSIRSYYREEEGEDGEGLGAKFNESVKLTYVDELATGEDEEIPVFTRVAEFESPSDAEVEGFARQLRRGALQRDVLFNTAQAYFELGKRSLEGGAVQRGRRQILESRRQLLRLISIYPDDDIVAEATYYLGNIFYLLGEYEEAVNHFRTVVEKWPDTDFKGKALFKLGMAHMEADKVEEAIESFVSLAYHHKDSPLVADAMLALSKRFGDEEKYDRAIEVGRAFVRKFESHEKLDAVYMQLAGWMISEEKYSDAADILDEAEKRLPDSPRMPAFLYWHADCLVKMGEMEKAIVMLQRVKYDYSDTQWAKYATARLAEVED